MEELEDKNIVLKGLFLLRRDLLSKGCPLDDDFLIKVNKIIHKTALEISDLEFEVQNDPTV